MQVLYEHFACYKLKIGLFTNEIRSNNYCITHFDSYLHSKIAQEQNASKFCMYSIISLTVVLAVVYILAVGLVSMRCVYRLIGQHNSFERANLFQYVAKDLRDLQCCMQYQLVSTYFNIN